MADKGIKTPIEPGIVQRVAAGLRYAFTGKEPGWFGPAEPLQPVAPPDTAGRAFDYPMSVNLQMQPRTGEPITFPMLRALADSYDLLRLVIETRKDQVVKMDWQIKPLEGENGKGSSKNDPRIEALQNFFKFPDRVHSWQSWLRILLEDMLVLDAPCVYPRLTVGGDIYGFEPVDGATIKIVIDQNGRPPVPPAAAYQQILKGLPANDYTYEELIYIPRNPRAHKIYGYCYDAATEILTYGRGWIAFSEVVIGKDLVATRDKAGAFEWQSPSRLVVEDWNGPMIQFQSRSVDLMVTPEHRMLINALPRPLGGKRSRKGEAIVAAQDLAENYNHSIKIPMTSKWEGIEVGEKSFGLGIEGNFIEVERQAANGTQTFTRRANIPRVRTYSGNDYCALMGAYLSEGNVRVQGGIEVAQRPFSKGYADYKKLFTRLGGSHNGRGFVLPHRALTEHFRQFGHAHEKYIPQEVMDSTPKQLEIFWNHFVLGDGHFELRKNFSGRGTQPHHAVRLTTVSRRMADQLTEIAQKLGWSASVRTLPPRKQRIMEQEESDCRETYIITVRYSAAMGFKAAKVNYAGKIYCVTVPNGIVYVRRNGKPAWCGNSPVEQIIVSVNMALRRQMHQLEFYTEGTIPDALLEVPQDWTVDQIKEFQIWWDSILSGQTDIRRKVRFIPGGMKPHFTKEAILKDEMDEWLARIVCYCFSVPPTPFVKQMNRATAASVAEAALNEGLVPVLTWIKGFMDYIIWKFFKYEDLEFAWQMAKEIDADVQSTIQDRDVRAGIRTLDEVRDEKGLDAYPGGIGKEPLVYTASGPVLLSEAIKPPEPVPATLAPFTGTGGSPIPPENNSPGGEGGTPEKQALPPGEEGKTPPPPPQKVEKRGKKSTVNPIDRERPLLKAQTEEMQEILSTGFAKAGKDMAAQVVKEMPESMPEDLGAAVDRVVLALDVSKINEVVTEIDGNLEKVAADGAAMALIQINYDREGITELLNEKALEYAQTRGAELVGKKIVDGELVDNPNAAWSIGENTRDMLRGDISQAIEQGWSNDRLATAIEENHGFSPARAEMIARTETAFADCAGNMAAYQESGIVRGKEWLLGSEHDDDDECDLNSEAGVIPLDEPFPSGDEYPPLHPRCVCDFIPALIEGVDQEEKGD